ncbi:hypothetical protein BDF19DRAFT_433088, partial [Syncephalis fuscata]
MFPLQQLPRLQLVVLKVFVYLVLGTATVTLQKYATTVLGLPLVALQRPSASNMKSQLFAETKNIGSINHKLFIKFTSHGATTV